MTALWIELLLVWAAWVVVPLGLVRIRTARTDDGHATAGSRTLAWGPRVAGLPLLALVVTEAPGLGAALCVLPWLAFTAGIALEAIVEVLARRVRSVEDAMRVMASVYLPVGAAWLLAWAAGWHVMGFGGTEALLTAAHFHYAGFGACALAATLGPWVPASLRSAWKATSASLALGIALVAAGITVSEWTGWRLLEMGAAWFTSGSVLALAACGFACSGRVPGTARAMALAMASTAALGAGTLSAWFAWVGLAGLTPEWLTWMVSLHGSGHALAVVSLGLVSLPPAPGAPPAAKEIPFSRLGARGFVGPEFFVDSGALNPGAVAHGLTDDFAGYASPSFPAAAVDPRVAAFYEQTHAFELQVVARWDGWLAWGGRIWAALAGVMGQLSLPLDTDRPEQIRSRIVALRADVDGRPGVRGWVRTRTRGAREQAIYVAAYASHTDARRRYMNIAFPLWRANMTSVLRIDAHTSPTTTGGILLTTLWDPAEPTGHQGVYAVLPGLRRAFRLPLDETITVWPVEPHTWKTDLRFTAILPDEAPDLVAAHDMWIFGWRYLRLEYWMKRSAVEQGGGSVGRTT
jgi:hypothetical protein